MLCLDVRVERRVGKVLFTTSTHKVSALDVFAGSATGLGGFELFLVLVLFLLDVEFLLSHGRLLFGDGSGIH